MRLLVWLAGAPLLLFLLLPVAAVCLQTRPASLALSLGDPDVQSAVGLSLLTSLAGLGLSVLAGTPVAYLLARFRFPGRTVLETLVDLPMVLPPTVAGVALLLAFGRRGLVGWMSPWSLPFTTVAVVLAQLFVAAPFFVKSAGAGFAAVPRDLEEAAAVDGASPVEVFWHVTWPLSRAALLAGALLAWARALGEFGATIIFAGNLPGVTQTMPLAIYMGFELELQTALTLSVVLLTLSLGVLLAARATAPR